MAEEKHRREFKEQIEELPEEFLIALEEYKEAHFVDTVAYALSLLGENNDFSKLSDQEKDGLLEIFRVLHHYGFYGGVSFTLDPDQEYVSPNQKNQK